ncbi:hypothetical protein [Xanthomonas hortorum]|uniref:hypothetical protein n=1 Tax=Xanthomonas hortorum TaxID=56454 RepID=UPI00145964B9|nr:hypothetical protein [Xanthomonas hortorum]MCM5525385.1 hypothetical protein [Xanthomonas hortorum pv. pelargonii]MCM5537881.1 hypothetical protein [Xanthomonas hortorum pv. pelargonii]MCM5542025.1 hypothetical protein [Xanthomonas hortorum pv. pelargonii]MCM5545515.1 hypothetical protein [Xanthomonas hortorum pv. pelargonii]MCM5563534.1 hypothetical protein [Xanthomonas hortorum pv. pelargonii]
MASTTGEGKQSIVCIASLQREGSGNADGHRVADGIVSLAVMRSATSTHHLIA